MDGQNEEGQEERKEVMAKKIRKVRMVASPRRFPTLDDLKKSVPGGGLLDPCLRRGVSGKVPTIKEVFGR